MNAPTESQKAEIASLTARLVAGGNIKHVKENVIYWNARVARFAATNSAKPAAFFTDNEVTAAAYNEALAILSK